MLTRATSASVKNAVQMGTHNNKGNAYEITGPAGSRQGVRKQNTNVEVSNQIELGYQKQMKNLFKVISKPDLANEMTRRTEGTTVETTIHKTYDSHNNSVKDAIKNNI